MARALVKILSKSVLWERMSLRTFSNIISSFYVFVTVSEWYCTEN